MANTVAIDVKINALEASKSLKELRTNLKDAVNELAGLESGTQEFNKLASAVDDAKDRIEKLNQDIEQVGGAGKFAALADFGSKIAAGFEVATGAMALFGSESKEVEQALKQVQAAMAMAQGLRDLSELGKSFQNFYNVVNDIGSKGVAAIRSLWTAIINGEVVTKAITVATKAWNLALSANPIFLIITALAALAAGVTFLMTRESEETKVLKANIEERKKQEEQIVKKYNREIALAKAAGKEVSDLELQKSKAVENNIKSQLEAYDKLKKSKGSLNEEELKEYQTLQNKLFDATTDRLAKEEEELRKSRERSIKYNEAALTNETRLLKSKMSDRGKEIYELEEKRQNELKELGKLQNVDNEKEYKEYQKRQNDIEEYYSIEKNKINSKYGQEASNKAKELRDKELAKRKEYEDKIKADLERNRLEEIQNLQNQAKQLELNNQLTYERKVAFENSIYQLETKKAGLMHEDLEKLRLQHLENLKKLEEDHKKQILELEAKERDKKLKQLEIDRLEITKFKKLTIDDEVLLETKKYEILKSNKELNDQELQLLEAEHLNKIKQLADQKFAEDEERRKKEKENKEAAIMGTLNVTKAGLQATADLVSAFAGKSKESQKKAFEFQKGVNIATAIIDTYQSAVAAYKSALLTPIVGNVLAPIAAGVAVAAGIANIRKIEQTTFDSKDSPSSGGGGGGGGSFAPNLSAPVGNTSTNLASIGFGQEQTAEPVKVFVTETDISSSQKNVQKIEQKASIE